MAHVYNLHRAKNKKKKGPKHGVVHKTFTEQQQTMTRKQNVDFTHGFGNGSNGFFFFF